MKIFCGPTERKMTVLLFWGAALGISAYTFFCVRELRRPEEGLPAPALEQKQAPAPPQAEAIEKAFRRRLQALEDVSRALAARDEASESESGAAYALRPQLRLRGIFLSKGSRGALIFSRSRPQGQILREGQSMEGVLIRKLAKDGASCLWRGQKFFLPLE